MALIWYKHNGIAPSEYRVIVIKVDHMIEFSLVLIQSALIEVSIN